MPKIYISLAVSATMFPENCAIKCEPITAQTVQNILDVHPESEIVSALNPSHATTLDVIRRRYGLELPIPERAPKVSLQSGDSLVIIQANLPRLNEGERHSDETVENAPISFRFWSVK